MAKTLKQPTDRRGVAKLTASLDRLTRRERIAALALAVLLALLLAMGIGSAVGGGLPFGGEEEARGASGLPSNWANLEPLLPLAPSLKDIASLKRAAGGEASGVLAAESGGGGALRLRDALPEGTGVASGGEARVASGRTSSGRPEPAALRALAVLRAPKILRVPSVRRILVTRLTAALGATNDLLQIIENDLRNLPGLPIDLDVDLPPIYPLPGGFPLPSINPPPLPSGGSVPAIPGGGVPLNVTVVNSQADSSFDVLLIARGRRLVEAYRFHDRDIAGLAAQINLRSSVLVADVLRDGQRLARVTAAPLRFAAAGGGSGTGAAGASRGGGAIGTGQASPASAGSGAKLRTTVRSRRQGRSRGGSVGGGTSSSRRLSLNSSSQSGSGTPRRATTSRRSTTPRRSTPTRIRRSSPPGPKSKPRARGGGRSKPSKPKGGSSGGGDDEGEGKGKKDKDDRD